MKKFQNAKILDSMTSTVKGGTFTYDHPIVIDTGIMFIGNGYRSYEDRQTDTGQAGEHDICGVLTDNADAPNGNP